MKPLVLGLGNDLLGDDGIGILAVRRLGPECSVLADVVESGLHCAALIDLLIGYRRVIIIDAVTTGQYPPGTIIDLIPSELDAVPSPSPHFSGLPELKTLAAACNLPFPEEIKIVAIEVSDPYTIGGSISRPVADSLDRVVALVTACLRQWAGADSIETQSCPAAD